MASKPDTRSTKPTTEITETKGSSKGNTRPFRFIVRVDTDSAERALQVMTERIYYDEDYGFDYQVAFVPLDEANPSGR
jgi:hypothetical protein